MARGATLLDELHDIGCLIQEPSPNEDGGQAGIAQAQQPLPGVLCGKAEQFEHLSAGEKAGHDDTYSGFDGLHQ
jgi:hypothetical protein